MTRDTPRGLGPPPVADATDPSTLAEVTDPDGLLFETENDLEAGDAVDALIAFEQRRKIYPQAAGSSSSDGSVAASYHAVHDVPRAHHDTLPTGGSAAPVVVDLAAQPVDEPAPMPAPERAVDRARDVSTFSLPRTGGGRPVLIAVLAALAGVVALLAVFVLRATGSGPGQGVTDHPAAAREIAPLAVPAARPSVVQPPSLPSAPASAPVTSTAASAPLPVKAIASSAPRSRPSASPPSSRSNATPASARPAGDFDDLVRETKP